MMIQPESFHFYRAMLCIRGTSHGPVSVCLSVTSRCSIETAEQIELVFGMSASFHPSYTVLKGNSVISKIKGTSLWNFVLNSGLRKFRHGISIVERAINLARERRTPRAFYVFVLCLCVCIVRTAFSSIVLCACFLM